MTKKEFAALLQSKALLLDGATGSNLMARGMPRGVCTELWVRDNPEILLQLQREYVAAGSQVIYASSFSANPLNMAEKGEVRRIANMENVTLVQKVPVYKLMCNKDISAAKLSYQTMTGEKLC